MAGSSKRIGKELEAITNNPPAGMEISLANENLHEWVVIMDGPDGSPYAGGKFNVLIHLPNEYPFKPPTVNFKTRIYHPNVTNDETGGVCLDVVKADVWKPSSKLEAVLLAIKKLLAEPRPDDAVESSIAEVYKNNRKQYDITAKEYTKKHASK